MLMTRLPFNTMGRSVVVCSFLVLASLANAVPVDHRHENSTSSSTPHVLHRHHHNSTAAKRTGNFVVNATTVPEQHSNSTERHGRENYLSPQNNAASERFIDVMDVLKPVAGFINGDFGSGLIEPSIPFVKKDDGTSAAAAVAAAFSPIEPVIAPFKPYAMYYTGATPADIINLNPQKDLVYPFLDPPKNLLLHIKDEKDKDKIKFRDIDGSLESMMGQASRLTSEQQLAYQQALEAWKQSQIANFQRQLPLGIGGIGAAGLDLSPFGPLGLGVTGPAGLAGLGVPGLGVPGFGFGGVPGTVPGVYNPLVSPFYPFAYYYTGASPADFNGLNNADLLYPFLDPPLNVLGAIKDDKDKIKFRIPAGVAQVGDNIQIPPSPNARPINLSTPQAVSAVVKDLAAKHRSAGRRDNPTTRVSFADAAGAVATNLAGIGTLGVGAGAGAFGLAGLGALGAGAAGIGPLPGDPGVNFVDKDALAALSPLSTTFGGFRPLSDFVYPFLPADKNPFLSLLYYITPAPLRTASRMNKADNLISSSVAARIDLTPYQAVGLAQSLKEVVAAAELNHMLRNLGLGDASSALIQSFAPVASKQTRQSVIGTLNALGLNPFEDLIDDVFDGGKEDEKLGKIPGAAPILHYFYPHLPKKVLKPFKPVVDLRQAGILGALSSGNKALNALGLNPFEDLVDDVFGGGKDDEKLGKIPGAAPILHYFYPYLPKKVLKPFKPLVDVRIAEMAARNAMSQRLLELKYAAAARAAAKSRYQQRILEAMGMPSLRRGRQIDPDSDLDSALDEAADSSLDAEDQSENLDFKESGDNEEAENETLGEENADISAGDLFDGQSKNPLAQAFRFFLPEMGIEDVDMEKAANGHADILENPEVMGENTRIGRALDIIQQSIIDNAPFPMNKIYSDYMSIRFPMVAARQQRSLKASFNESLANLRKLQLKSLSLNDSFAAEVNSTATAKAQRTGRQLGDILGAALPFPFNLLLSFLPQANSGQQASGLDSASLDGLGGDAEATLSESDGDLETDDIDSALRAAGLSGSESDRRMAAMVGTVLPAPLDALVTMVAPFRSLEQELESESNAEEGNSSEAEDQVLKSFQNSLQAIHDQYVSKQDSVSSTHDGNSDHSTQALAMQALNSV